MTEVLYTLLLYMRIVCSALSWVNFQNSLYKKCTFWSSFIVLLYSAFCNFFLLSLNIPFSILYSKTYCVFWLVDTEEYYTFHYRVHLYVAFIYSAHLETLEFHPQSTVLLTNCQTASYKCLWYWEFQRFTVIFTICHCHNIYIHIFSSTFLVPASIYCGIFQTICSVQCFD